MNIFHRRCSSFENVRTDKNWYIKTIDVSKCKIVSLQSHKLRAELLFILEGDGVAEVEDLETKQIIKHILSSSTKVFIPRMAKHRLFGVTELKIVEISLGKFDENDITRYEDDFGRI